MFKKKKEKRKKPPALTDWRHLLVSLPLTCSDIPDIFLAATGRSIWEEGSPSHWSPTLVCGALSITEAEPPALRPQHLPAVSSPALTGYAFLWQAPALLPIQQRARGARTSSPPLLVLSQGLQSNQDPQGRDQEAESGVHQPTEQSQVSHWGGHS